MANYNKFREQFHKAFNRCEDCNGAGYPFSEEQCPVHGYYCNGGDKKGCIDKTLKCKTCNGLGYVIPLEFGCEVMIQEPYSSTHNPVQRRVYGYSKELNEFESMKHGWIKQETVIENLGKPLTLQDVLRMISKDVEISKDNNHLYLEYGEYNDCLTLDLTKQPQDWGEEVWGQLLELVK